MEDRHIMKFLTAEKPTDAKRLSLISTLSSVPSFKLIVIRVKILDLAIGLLYLPEKKIVQGDLKGVLSPCLLKSIALT
jgi:hypothetical protein